MKGLSEHVEQRAGHPMAGTQYQRVGGEVDAGLDPVEALGRQVGARRRIGDLRR